MFFDVAIALHIHHKSMSPLGVLGQKERSGVSPKEPQITRFDLCSLNSHRIRIYNLNIINQCLLSVFFDRKKKPQCVSKTTLMSQDLIRVLWFCHRIKYYNLNIINQCLLSMFLDRKKAPMCLQRALRSLYSTGVLCCCHRIRFYNLSIINQCLLSVSLDRNKAPMCLQKSLRSPDLIYVL